MNILSKEKCRFDEISLGEVMLRLDPGEGRIKSARSFNAWEGGGEYNVARGLRRCFNLRTSVVTALADNEVGRLIEDFILQGGVDTSYIQWSKYDGIGRSVRILLLLNCVQNQLIGMQFFHKESDGSTLAGSLRDYLQRHPM